MARPRSGFPTKRSTSYRVPRDLEKKIEDLLESELLLENPEFSTQSDIITASLRYWFENRDKPKIPRWLVSEDGNFISLDTLSDMVIKRTEERKKEKQKEREKDIK